MKAIDRTENAARPEGLGLVLACARQTPPHLVDGAPAKRRGSDDQEAPPQFADLAGDASANPGKLRIQSLVGAPVRRQSEDDRQMAEPPDPCCNADGSQTPRLQRSQRGGGGADCRLSKIHPAAARRLPAAAQADDTQADPLQPAPMSKAIRGSSASQGLWPEAPASRARRVAAFYDPDSFGGWKISLQRDQ